ncbi:TPA: hypothetical protein ACX3IP_003624 [Vibrio parahaemolyticus]
MNTASVLTYDAQLQLPFIFDDLLLENDEEPIEKVTPLTIVASCSERTVEQEFETENETWTDGQIKELREAFLRYSLNVLADGRSGKKAKDEAYEWLNSDEVHPFSFVTCCVLSGYDPDEVRNLCQYTLRQLAKRNK